MAKSNDIVVYYHKDTTPPSGKRSTRSKTTSQFDPYYLDHFNMSSSWSPLDSHPPPIPEGVIPTTDPTTIHNNYQVKTREPTGLEYTWRLWRHCCCRYGWYPLLIAPLVTTGCLLSIYSAFGCDFVRVEIGFIPANAAWNQSSSEFGLFSYQSGYPENDKYLESFVEGCQEYPSGFSEIFIDGDRTWKVARIMAYISGISSLIGAVTACLFVISPLPAFFFWPGLLLPSLMAAFLAEGSKFLLFDTSMCRNTVWFPTGSDSLPQVAESCSLGSTSYYCMAAGVAFFCSLLLVCLKAPSKRFLDSDYGLPTTHLDPGTSEESPTNFTRHANASFGGNTDSYGGINDDAYSASRVSSIRDDRSEMQYSAGVSRSSRDYSRYDSETALDCTDSLSGRFSTSKEHRDLVSERLKSLDGNDDRYSTYSHNTSRIDEGDDDESSSSSATDKRYNPKKKHESKEAKGGDESVSESRLHTAERLRLSSITESRAMIERFVKEVNRSFAQDSKDRDDEDVNETQSVALQSSRVWSPLSSHISSSRSY